jgi:vanillate O-demethylase monooxygenase subunit
MFLKNCWYVAAWDHELIDSKLLPRTLLGERVLLYKGDSGRVVALKDRCCHRGAPLSLGPPRRRLRALHVPRAQVRPHGQMRADPGSGQDPRQAGRPQLSRGGTRRPGVDLDGRCRQGDANQILDFPYLRDPQWKGIPGYLHYDANYLLIVDNLSDFAHLAFVHTKTLGGSEEYAYVTKPLAMERLERGFRVERWHMNAPPPPFHRKVIPAAERTRHVDRRNIGHMHIRAPFSSTRSFRLQAVAPNSATSSVRASTATASS